MSTHIVANQQISQTTGEELTQSVGDRIERSQILTELREPFAIQAARMAIKSEGRVLFINLSDIIAVQAQGNYVRLQCESESFRVRESISEFAVKLKHFGFIRIHRSTLVNGSWVAQIRIRAGGSYLLRLNGGREFSLTRTYKRNLETLAELWLGSEDVS